MMIHVHATYIAGLIHPDQPLNLPDNTPIDVTIVANMRDRGSSPGDSEPQRPSSPRITVEELRALLDKYAVSVGSLPADFSRADIYQDHD